jgi:hypothetical protein
MKPEYTIIVYERGIAISDGIRIADLRRLIEMAGLGDGVASMRLAQKLGMAFVIVTSPTVEENWLKEIAIQEAKQAAEAEQIWVSKGFKPEFGINVENGELCSICGEKECGHLSTEGGKHHNKNQHRFTDYTSSFVKDPADPCVPPSRIGMSEGD